MHVFYAFWRLFFTVLMLFPVLPISALSDTIVNPNGTTVVDLTGTAGVDDITNEGTVTNDLTGNANSANDSTGGSNTITNAGTVGDDIYGSNNGGINSSGGSNTITNSGTVDYIYGSWNYVAGSNGGHNTIINSGTANDIQGSFSYGTGCSGHSNTIINSGMVSDDIVGSENGDNNSGGSHTIINSGTVSSEIFGSLNYGDNSSGHFNTITNSGTVGLYIFGSYNYGDNSSGGSHTITNSGMVGYAITGSHNYGINSNGGSNTITNTGTITGRLHGSFNFGDNSSGGGNTIINSGTVTQHIYGNRNYGANSSGGSNTIRNSGTVAGNIYGSENSAGTSTSLGNTIINSGTVSGDIWGSFNQFGSSGGDDTIINSGIVGGSIYGTDGNDTIIIVGGSSLGGVADGGTGIDTLGFNNMGTISSDSIGTIYLNFENLGFYGGSTNLVGMWDFSSGNVTVFEGNLYVNGSLYTDLVTVNASGLLGGTGTIYGNVVNFGTISPGNSIGTLAINGKLGFMPGSTYFVELGPGGASDRINTTGSVNIIGGTTRAVLSRSLYTDGQQWLIISAGGGIYGTFDSLVTNLKSQTLNLNLVYGSNTVTIVLQRTPYAALGATVNQKNIGASLDSIVPLAKNDMASLLIGMDFDMSLVQIQNTLNAINPEMYATFMTAGLKSTGIIDQTTALHQSERRLQKQFGLVDKQEQGWNVWARILGNKSERDSEDGYLGHSQEMNGIVTGLDRLFSDWLLAGFTLAYSDSDLSWNENNKHRGSMQGRHIGGYVSVDLGDVFVDSSISYADFDNNGGRDITFAYGSGLAGSDFGSSSLLGRIKGGYDLRFNELQISPVASIGYIHLEQDSFTEAGVDYLSLNIDESDAESVTSALGLQLAGLIKKEQWKFLPRAELSWVHEYKDDGQEITASFVDYSSAPFTVSGISPVTDYGLLELSLSAEYGKDLSFFLDYTVALAEGYDSHLVVGGLAYRF